MNIIPKPQRLVKKDGMLRLNPRVVLNEGCLPDDFFCACELKKTLLESLGVCDGIVKSRIPECGAIYLVNKNESEISEKYKLVIEAEGVSVIGESAKGLFYGVQTLRQIIMMCGLMLPFLEIEDFPSLAVRGLYLDITRGRIPKLDTLKDIVDRLAFYKINHMQFYVEHCYAFSGFSEALAGRCCILPEEILALDEYAYRRNVEIVPSLATCGHLYEVLQTESFKAHCELPSYTPAEHRWTERQKHHTIYMANQQSREFVKKMIDEYYPLFRSKTFNICFDEIFDMAKGRSKTVADTVGSNELFNEYLGEIAAHVAKRGLRLMLWGNDVSDVRKDYSKLPADTIVGVANYDDVPDEARIRTSGEGANVIYSVPGMHSWSQILNDYRVAYENIAAMADITKRYGYQGMLNCLWGDEGHSCHFESSFPFIALGAELSWNIEQKIDRQTFFKTLSVIEYGKACGETANVMYELSELQSKFVWAERMPISFLWYFFIHLTFSIERNQLSEFVLKWINDESATSFRNAAEGSLVYLRRLEELRSAAPLEKRKRFRELINAAEGVYAISRACDSLLHYPNSPSPEVAEGLETWLAAYSEVWRESNKESELHEIVSVVCKAAKLIRERG